MDLVPSLVNAFVVVAMGVLITFVTRSQIQDVKANLGELKQDIRDVKSEVRDLRTEINARFRDQGNEIAALRSDVTQLALAIGATPRPQTG